MSPAELSLYTLKYIDQAPMFNPLEFNTVMPTGTSGIIPTGVYLATHPSAYVESKDYNVKDAVCRKAMSGGAGGAGADLPQYKKAKASSQEGGNQKGGSEDYSFYHPAGYPGNVPSTDSPQYIGVTCGTGCGEGCGVKGPGKFQPFKTNKDGRLERCRAHYSATSSYGPGCGVCENGPKPAIWNTAMPNPYRCGTTYGPTPCGGCGSCPPCLEAAKYHYSPGCKFQAKECHDLYGKLMALDTQRLWALCKDNYVKLYDIDKETGRLTPKNKPRLCRRLSRTLEKTGNADQVFLY